MALRSGVTPIYKRDVSAPKHLVVISRRSGLFGKISVQQSGSYWNLVVPMQDDRFQYGNLTTRPVTALRIVQSDADKPVPDSIYFVAMPLVPKPACTGG